MTGTVLLRILVDEKGAVIDAEVVKGVDLLTEFAVKCVNKRHYLPAAGGGVPVPFWVDPVSITLESPR